MQIRININDALIEAIAAGIRVFITRDNVALSEAQIQERARNIAMTLMALDLTPEVDAPVVEAA